MLRSNKPVIVELSEVGPYHRGEAVFCAFRRCMVSENEVLYDRWTGASRMAAV